MNSEKDLQKHCEKPVIPGQQEDIAFWAGIHKTILALNKATETQKADSRSWLMKNGFSVNV